MIQEVFFYHFSHAPFRKIHIFHGKCKLTTFQEKKAPEAQTKLQEKRCDRTLKMGPSNPPKPLLLRYFHKLVNRKNTLELDISALVHFKMCIVLENIQRDPLKLMTF